MKITYFQNSTGGCDWYRAILPMDTIKEKEAALVERAWPANILCDIQYNPTRFEEYMSSDIILLQRLNTESFLNRMRDILEGSKAKIVLDHDDNVFSVSPFSPHYVDYGTEEAKMRLPNGDMVDLWKDGHNIDLKKNKKMLEGVKACLERADMVTTTTDFLADNFRQYNQNVRVLPNCVDLNEFQRIDRNDDEVRIFWSGGWSHYEDWFLLKDVLPVVMKKYKNARLVLMGFKFDSTLKEIDPAQIRYIDKWTDSVAYSYRLSLVSPDISIIPLKDTYFNWCKSPIKWVEMGALSVPSVCSFIKPYSPLAELGDNGVYIEDNDKDAWIEGISKLIEDEDLRKKIGANARKTVEQHFDINTQYHQWVNAYQEVLCQSPRTLQPTS
jgi:glycosyltransferase involved in cell wall biosynthesis